MAASSRPVHYKHILGQNAFDVIRGKPKFSFFLFLQFSLKFYTLGIFGSSQVLCKMVRFHTVQENSYVSKFKRSLDHQLGAGTATVATAAENDRGGQLSFHGILASYKGSR